MFTAEALQLIQETAQQAEKVSILDTSEDGRKVFYDVQGNREQRDAPPPNRQHLVESVADLIEYAIGHPDAVVYHNWDRVVLVLDDSDRRDQVTFRLVKSSQFSRLAEMQSAPTWVSQRAMLLTLRLELGVPPEYVSPFRKLNWTGSQATSSTVGQARESLGKDIHAEVNSADGLPDELVIQVPVYQNPGERTPQAVCCGLEIDVAQQTFLLSPFPGQLSLAEEIAQLYIHERLVDGLSGIPCYYGSP